MPTLFCLYFLVRFFFLVIVFSFNSNMTSRLSANDNEELAIATINEQWQEAEERVIPLHLPLFYTLQ